MSLFRVPTTHVAVTHVVLRRVPAAPPVDRSADRSLLAAALGLPPADRFGAAVRATAARLDELRPGWWDVVDLVRLDMRSCRDCVGGQVYGYYVDALDALGTDVVTVTALAGACPRGLWVTEVLARRAAPVAAEVTS